MQQVLDFLRSPCSVRTFGCNTKLACKPQARVTRGTRYLSQSGNQFVPLAAVTKVVSDHVSGFFRPFKRPSLSGHVSVHCGSHLVGVGFLEGAEGRFHRDHTSLQNSPPCLYMASRTESIP